MKRNIELIRIALKSLLIKNGGNKLFLICIILLMFIPTLLYNITQSVIEQVESTHKSVYGNFTDIYYDSTDVDNPTLDFSEYDFNSILPNFHYNMFGVFFTIYQQELSSNKSLYVGYADEEALSLAEVKILKGALPKRDDEIAFTQSIAVLLGNKTIGEKVKISDSTYTISGIVQDFGHLWPKGELQIKGNINPVNAFVTQQEAKILMKQTKKLIRQILVVRQLGVANSIESNSNFFRNINNSIENNKKFIIPNEFLVIIYIASSISILMILFLNRNRVLKRLEIYYLLGLVKSEICYILRFELIIISIVGVIIGTTLGVGASLFALKILSAFIESPIPLSINIFSIVILSLILFISIAILVLIFSQYIVNVACDKKQKNKRFQKEVKKISLLRFELSQNRRSLLLLSLVVSFAFSLLSFSIFYGNFFTRDILEAPSGTITRDYDFQFIVHPQPASPIAKGEKAFYFTNTYEKIGATDAFINDIVSDDVVKSVKAYKEMNKMHILMKENQIDDYIDAYDFVLDGKCNQEYNTGIVNLDFVSKNFGYKNDEILVGAEILTYPPYELEKLQRSVVEGRIDLNKIITGEEVILRVPAFTIENLPNGSIFRTPMNYTQEGAINSTTFNVGDEIHLSGLLTDELINGPVAESKVKSYYRHDVIVKVGAIIRNTDGLFYTQGHFGRPFSILTLDEALKSMNIPSTYSIVSIYTKDGFNSSELSQRIANYSYKVPYMILQDWQLDIKTYKVFNLMVYIFVASLLGILILSTLIILMSQLFIKTQLSMKNYALLRINGLSFLHLIHLWLIQVYIIVFSGCLIGVPISIFLMQNYGIKAEYNILYHITYYFPLVNLLYVFVAVLLITTISIIPCLIYFRKHKNNILFDIH